MAGEEVLCWVLSKEIYLVYMVLYITIPSEIMVH